MELFFVASTVITKTVRLAPLIIALLGGLSLPSLALDLAGTWNTENNDAVVRIGDCGGALCATILSLREPNDSQTGRPKIDTHNTDPSKRNRPIVGIQVLTGLRPQGANKWAGQAYNPEDGKTYDIEVMLESANMLKIQGCVLFICQTKVWTRKG